MTLAPHLTWHHKLPKFSKRVGYPAADLCKERLPRNEHWYNGWVFGGVGRPFPLLWIFMHPYAPRCGSHFASQARKHGPKGTLPAEQEIIVNVSSTAHYKCHLEIPEALGDRLQFNEIRTNTAYLKIFSSRRPQDQRPPVQICNQH